MADDVLDDCPLCLEPIPTSSAAPDAPTAPFFLPCTHALHERCARRLLTHATASQACPVCRAPLHGGAGAVVVAPGGATAPRTARAPVPAGLPRPAAGASAVVVVAYGLVYAAAVAVQLALYALCALASAAGVAATCVWLVLRAARARRARPADDPLYELYAQGWMRGGGAGGGRGDGAPTSIIDDLATGGPFVEVCDDGDGDDDSGVVAQARARRSRRAGVRAVWAMVRGEGALKNKRSVHRRVWGRVAPALRQK